VVDSRECLAIDGAGRGTPTIDSGTPMCHYTPKKSLEKSTYWARLIAETEMFETSHYKSPSAVPVVQAAKCWRVKETCSGCSAAAHCIEEGRANEKLLDNGCAGLLVGGDSACEHASKKTCTGDARASPAEDLTCQEKIIEGDCTGAKNCQWLAVCHWRDEVDMLYQPLHKDCKDANGKNWQEQIPLLGKNSDGTTNTQFGNGNVIRDNDGTDNTNDGTVLECLTDAANPASNVAPYEAGDAGDAGTRGVCSNSNDVAFFHQYSVKSLSKTNNGLGAGSVDARKFLDDNDDFSMIEGPSTGAALKGLSKAQAKMAKKHLKLKGDCKKCVVKDLDNLIESPESMQSVIDNSYFKNMATGSKKEHKCVAAWAEPSDMELKCLDKASCF